jgi:hypothetical protein
MVVLGAVRSRDGRRRRRYLEDRWHFHMPPEYVSPDENTTICPVNMEGLRQAGTQILFGLHCRKEQLDVAPSCSGRGERICSIVLYREPASGRKGLKSSCSYKTKATTVW